MTATPELSKTQLAVLRLSAKQRLLWRFKDGRVIRQATFDKLVSLGLIRLHGPLDEKKITAKGRRAIAT